MNKTENNRNGPEKKSRKEAHYFVKYPNKMVPVEVKSQGQTLPTTITDATT